MLVPTKRVVKSHSFQKNNNQGFTLIEAMVAIFITSLVLFLLTFFVKHFESIKEFDEKDNFYQWQLFLKQWTNEIEDENIVFLESSSKRIRFKNMKPKKHREKEIVDFYLKQEGYLSYRLLRLVNQAGFHPMLLHLSDGNFSVTGDTLNLWVKFQNGEEYETHILIRKEVEGIDER